MHRQCSSDVMEPIGSDRNGPRRMQPSRTRRFLLSGLLAALLGVAGATPVMAAPPLLPPVVDPASQEHHVGKVILVELVTPDLAAAKQFYAGLFGWTYRDMPTDGTLYAQASLDGRPVAGLVQRQIPAGEHRQPTWLTFIAAHDVDATTQLAVQHGAKVLFEPHSLPDRGREAVLADPQGAVFAVLASSSGDPPDLPAAPGEDRKSVEVRFGHGPGLRSVPAAANKAPARWCFTLPPRNRSSMTGRKA